MPAKRAKTRTGVVGGSCMDCGIDTMARGEYYMLRDTIWRTLNPLVLGMLCFRCAEGRLGRPLHGGDFSSAPVNKTFAHGCPALAERLQRRLAVKVSVSRVKKTNIKAVRARLPKKKRTQSPIGYLSAALLPYRGANGRVPRSTMLRVLREIASRGHAGRAWGEAATNPLAQFRGPLNGSVNRESMPRAVSLRAGKPNRDRKLFFDGEGLLARTRKSRYKSCRLLGR